MHPACRNVAPYRRPQPLEASWQCAVSGQLFVHNRSPFAPDDAELRESQKPRCPCHHQLMRRVTAPWYGFPGELGKAAFVGSLLLGVWSLWNALPAVQELRMLLGQG